MTKAKIFSLVLTLLIITAGVTLASLFILPPELILMKSEQTEAQPPKPNTESKTEPAAAAVNEKPFLPSKAIAEMFYHPPRQTEPQIPELEPVIEEPPIVYNKTRLSYLGKANNDEVEKYFIKDNLYGDVFQIAPGETVFEFTITETDEAGIIFHKGEDYFKVLF